MAGYCLSSPLARAGMALLALMALQCVSGVPFHERVRGPPPRTCHELGHCCQGQNNTCFVFGPRMDRSPDSKRCYCDSNCLIMGDCCTDYHHTCRSQDCEVGEWEQWGECSNQCGYGSRRRTRRVRVYPDNGGHHCPVLKQRRACAGYKQEICQQNQLGSQEEESREQARILPIEFGRARKLKQFDPWSGILKNLYSNNKFNEIPTRATYRRKFRITETHYGCEYSDWADVLRVNATVCVECQPIAMKRDIGLRCMGHGVYHQVTTWKAVDVKKCHGKWEQVEPSQQEVCEYSVQDEQDKNFIFI